MLYDTLAGPITCQVELTTSCNNDCIHCYNHWRHDKAAPGAQLGPELLEQTLDQLIASKVFQVTFTGGETMLARPALFRGLERLFAADISCGVNTNLTRLTSADATRLYALGLRGVLSSVLSGDPMTHDLMSQRRGAYAETVRGIKIAHDAGLSVAASMVLTSMNADQVLMTGLAMKALGVNQFYATKASPPVNAQNFERYMISRTQLLAAMTDLNVLRDRHGLEVGILECYPLCGYGSTVTYPFAASRRCSAGITTCTIGADGGIRPCSHSDRNYGFVQAEGLPAAWQAMQDQRDGSLLPTVCRTCALLPSCSGGCRIDAFCCHGRYDALDPYADPDLRQQVEAPAVEISLVEPAARLTVNANLRTRREQHGVFVADRSRMGSPAFLTPETFDLVQQLSRRESFDASDVVVMTGFDLSNARLLCGMLAKDLIFRAR